MADARWTAVDDYFDTRLVHEDDALRDAVTASAAAGLPALQVSPTQGKLLHLLASTVGARQVLEIGTLGGYSAIWLARALPAEGRLVTLELDPAHAAVARANLERAGVADRVEVRVGHALGLMPDLVAERLGPFDLVFIDADKPSNPDYVWWALQLTRPGSLIVVDDVVRGGAVADPGTRDPSAVGSRRVVEMIAEEPRLAATALQTVGRTGHDGFIVARVIG